MPREIHSWPGHAWIGSQLPNLRVRRVHESRIFVSVSWSPMQVVLSPNFAGRCPSVLLGLLVVVGRG